MRVNATESQKAKEGLVPVGKTSRLAKTAGEAHVGGRNFGGGGGGDSLCVVYHCRGPCAVRRVQILRCDE